MKPINSKERSKQVWQFLIVFAGLALIPVAIIFFAYYKVPDKISETDNQKLVNYSNFEHTQKEIVKKMEELDSNLYLYATATDAPGVREKKIVNGLDELGKIDTSFAMVKLVSDAYNKHYEHVADLRKTREQLKAVEAELRKKEQELTQQARQGGMMNGAPAMGLPPG